MGYPVAYRRGAYKPAAAFNRPALTFPANRAAPSVGIPRAAPPALPRGPVPLPPPANLPHAPTSPKPVPSSIPRLPGSAALPAFLPRLAGRLLFGANALGLALLLAELAEWYFQPGAAYDPRNFDASKNLAPGWTAIQHAAPPNSHQTLVHTHNNTGWEFFTTVAYSSGLNRYQNLTDSLAHSRQASDMATSWSTATQQAWIMDMWYQAGSIYVANAARWQFYAAAPSVYPFVDAPPVIAPAPAPIGLPDLHPLLNPIGVPRQMPARRPYSVPVTVPDPWDMPGRSREGAQPSAPRQPIRELVPETAVSSTTRTITMKHPPRRKKPDRKKEREKKGAAQKAVAMAAHAAFALTEFDDLLEALLDAMPKKYRPKSKKLADKLQALWDNWDQIDIAEAVGNIVKNHIEDKVVGYFNRKSADALKSKFGATATGLNTGQGGLPDAPFIPKGAPSYF